MVKNTKGGSGHKSQARKNVAPTGKAFTSHTRFAIESGEIYSQVSKVLGNGMCYVLCQDNKTRLCHFRGKFRGRGKRDNNIINGTWVLVGTRDYESVKVDKMANCDLLEIYSDLDKERLKVLHGVDWSLFTANDYITSSTKRGVDDEVSFSRTDRTEEYENMMTSMTTPLKMVNTLSLKGTGTEGEESGDGEESGKGTNDFVDIDDI